MTIKLLYSPLSPYVRKVLVCSHELGLFQTLKLVRMAANPVAPDLEVRDINPLGKIPTAIVDGVAIFDSRVICELLDSAAGGGQLFPAPGGERWRALTLQASADGLLDAALLARYESNLRPQALRWPDWLEGQMLKISKTLAYLEKSVPEFGDRVDIGSIAVGCAFGYLDLRFADLDWRSRHEGLSRWYDGFSRRDSMQKTRPEEAA